MFGKCYSKKYNTKCIIEIRAVEQEKKNNSFLTIKYVSLNNTSLIHFKNQGI